MKKTAGISVIAVCVIAATGAFCRADTIVLKSGKTVSGTILEETPEYIRIQQGENPIYYQRTYITDVIRDQSPSLPSQQPQTPGVAREDGGVREEASAEPLEPDYLSVGLKLAAQGQWDAAEETLKTGEVNNPYDSNILGALDLLAKIKTGQTGSECGLEVFKGTYALMREDYSGAATHLEKARALDPKQPDISYNLGVAYYSMGEFQKALGALEQVLRLKPDDAPTYVLVGNIYHLLGDKEKAQEHLYIAQTLFDKGGAVD